MEDIYYWVWLSILSLRPIEKIKLLEYFKDPKRIYLTNKKELELLINSNDIINEIIDRKKRIESEKVIEAAIENDIKIIKCTDKLYSKSLKNIYDYPIILYCKGNSRLLNEKCISIVGCRDCSEYGKKVAETFAYKLSKKGYTIVSGMASGIDSASHIGALIAREKTIAVLGSGVNYIYPYINKKIYDKILENEGLIISEYGVNKSPIPSFFPQRNRIISGLSEKILVVEATINSGSIITANLAIEQGKDVYAIPGNITSIKSSGTNELIKDGAILVSSIEDIINL